MKFRYIFYFCLQQIKNKVLLYVLKSWGQPRVAPMGEQIEVLDIRKEGEATHMKFWMEWRATLPKKASDYEVDQSSGVSSDDFLEQSDEVVDNFIQEEENEDDLLQYWFRW